MKEKTIKLKFKVDLIIGDESITDDEKIAKLEILFYDFFGI